MCSLSISWRHVTNPQRPRANRGRLIEWHTFFEESKKTIAFMSSAVCNVTTNCLVMAVQWGSFLFVTEQCSVPGFLFDLQTYKLSRVEADYDISQCTILSCIGFPTELMCPEDASVTMSSIQTFPVLHVLIGGQNKKIHTYLGHTLPPFFPPLSWKIWFIASWFNKIISCCYIWFRTVNHNWILVWTDQSNHIPHLSIIAIYGLHKTRRNELSL